MKTLLLLCLLFAVAFSYPAKWAFNLCLDERPTCQFGAINCNNDAFCIAMLNNYNKCVTTEQNCVAFQQEFGSETQTSEIPGLLLQSCITSCTVTGSAETKIVEKCWSQCAGI